MQYINNLVWIDLEMTGLNFRRDQILQVAVLVTDLDLNLIDPIGYVEYVKADMSVIDQMEPKVTKMLTKNGVLQTSIEKGRSIEEVDTEVYKYISKYVDHQESPLCGSSISADRTFIELFMPKVKKHLHYRNIDVSTIKQLVTMWDPEAKNRTKSLEHEALADIQESIEELRYYKKLLF